MKRLHKNIIIITISLVLGMSTSYLSISRSIKTTINITDSKSEKNYKVNFKSKTKIPSTANTYTVENDNLSEQYLKELALKFSLNGDFSSDDIKFTCENDSSKLIVLKKNNLMKYVTINYENSTDEQTLINKAIEILSKYNLTFAYADVVCQKFNNTYEILFISEISNLKNYGFQNKIIFDLDGGLLTIEVYLNDFKKLGSLKIKPITQALKDLKIETDKAIELNYYELVYVYNKSILEPAYRVLTSENREIYLNAYN